MSSVTRSTTKTAGLLVASVASPASHQLADGSNTLTEFHPIFSPASIHGGIEYELVKPALLLASKLISTPALLSFWYTVFFSEVRPVYHILRASLKGCGAYEYHNVPSLLTDEQIRRTQAALHAFPRNVRYYLWTADLEGWAKPSGMETRSSVEGDFAYIMLSPSMLQELKQGAALTGRTGDSAFYDVESFAFAKTLVHELSHAVRLVIRGKGGLLLSLLGHLRRWPGVGESSLRRPH